MSSASGRRACQSIAQTMIGHFTTRLEVEARKSGGSLTAEEIREIAGYFLSEEAARFTSTFDRSYDDCSQSRAALHWDSVRRNPFERILTKKLAHLLEGPLSRRMLPGLMLAVDKMIGPELREQCERKAQAMMDRHRDAETGLCHWEALYASAEAKALANDVLVVMAHYFDPFEKRRDWFLSLVNSNLSAPTAPDDRWTLTDHGFRELMQALFTDLRTQLAKRQAQLRKRYGEPTVAALEGFLGRG